MNIKDLLKDSAVVYDVKGVLAKDFADACL
jgi:hypothetical protein